MARSSARAEEYDDHQEKEISPDGVTSNSILKMLSEISEKLDALKETLASHSLSSTRPSIESSDVEGQMDAVRSIIVPRKSDDEILQECMDGLNAIEYMDPQLYAKGFRLLHYSDTFKKMFILVPQQRKRDLIEHY
ncbi:OLC1v1017315C1 [Oldenlandia corymbosa var. corymbosa]|uniref:OLC1v1017315C1 n=1 Tax=Oldenlandia corymbosa var. corymbosa TaxID=529605 RepID=A0AAV1E930_OLDCO|nr:OLC1v1017315C1 [Oldenlandia corymbosa var. corymbosa]